MTKKRATEVSHQVSVTDLSTGNVVVRDLEIADSWRKRFFGLMGRPLLEQGAGMYLEPCRQVHCFFMKFPIDVVFLDETGTVVGIEDSLRPWRISRYHPRAAGALELPAGTCRRLGIQPETSRMSGLKKGENHE